MKKYISALALSLVVAACSTTPYTGESVSEVSTPEGLNVIQSSSRKVLPSGVLAGEETELARMTATVDSIDHKTRVATLKTKDGRLVSVKIDPSVKNLNQVVKGDTVAFDYVESVEFEVRKPTQEEIALAGEELDVAARAAKGEKPGALVATARIDILVVESINKKKELITLRGPQGFVTVKSKYPQNLKLIKEGDTVVVRSSELLAAHVEEIG